MTNPELVTTTLQAKIVPETALQEFRRWTLALPEDQEQVFRTHEEITAALTEAYESSEQVKVRETELDVLQAWRDFKNRRKGTLVLIHGEEKGSSEVTFIQTREGRIIFPWASDSIVELLTNGDSYLRFSQGGNPRRVYFESASDLFFDDRKLFVSCVPDARVPAEKDE